MPSPVGSPFFRGNRRTAGTVACTTCACLVAQVTYESGSELADLLPDFLKMVEARDPEGRPGVRSTLYSSLGHGLRNRGDDASVASGAGHSCEAANDFAHDMGRPPAPQVRIEPRNTTFGSEGRGKSSRTSAGGTTSVFWIIRCHVQHCIDDLRAHYPRDRVGNRLGAASPKIKLTLSEKE